MSATYSGDPSADDKDAVRFLIGDTNVSSPLLTDEAILWVLSERTNVYRAAADCADQIAAQQASGTASNSGTVAERQVGDLRVRYETGGTSKTQDYSALAKQLRRTALVRTARPSVGGISINSKRNQESNDDRTQPAFKRGQFDHPDNPQPGGAASSTYSTAW